MAVMMPKEKWTDERLDNLNEKVDDGFAELGRDIRELRVRLDRMNDSINARFDSVNARFDSLNRNLIGVAAAIIAALIGVNVF
jgi:tetrahydromethanopterin S-methyltransferase subunit G